MNPVYVPIPVEGAPVATLKVFPDQGAAVTAGILGGWTDFKVYRADLVETIHIEAMEEEDGQA